jgi:DNA polymerase III alpha subunit
MREMINSFLDIFGNYFYGELQLNNKDEQHILNQYIIQCIENCDVLPIYCPDAKCVSKGTLSQSEIKHLLHIASKQIVNEAKEKESSIIVGELKGLKKNKSK